MNTLRYPKSKTGRPWSARLADQKGLSLIYIIVIMVIFAVLISASVVMFGTSTFTSATSNASQRATYLAESGLRLIREEFSKPSTPSEVNQLLADIYNKTYRLGGGNEGQFQITTIEPNWFSMTASTGATSITLTAPGTAIPTAFSSMGTDAIKTLMVAPKFYTYNNGGSLLGNTFSGSLTEGLLYNAVQVPVFRVSTAAADAAANSTSLTVTGTYFPEKRGQIGICESIASNICTNMRAFYYDGSVVAGSNRTLTSITPAKTTYTFPAVTAGTNVILLGSVKIASKGTFGQSQPVERTVDNVYRAVNLYTTTGNSGTPLSPEISDFDTSTQGLKNLIDPALSSIDQIKQIGEQGLDKALNLGAYAHTTGLMWWRWYNPNDNIASLPFDQYRLANYGNLSYGVQVKMYATDNAVKPYYITGLSFRLDDSNSPAAPAVEDNMYAVSFLKINSDYNTQNTTQEKYAWLAKIAGGSNWSNVTNGTWYLVLWKRVNGAWTLLGYNQLDNSDWVYDSVTSNTKTAFKAWSTIRVDVTEELATTAAGGCAVGDQCNIIKTYVQAASVTNGYPPTPPGPYLRRTTNPASNTPPDQYNAPIVWDQNGISFWHEITWTLPGGSTSSTIQDKDILTLNYAAIPAWTAASINNPNYSIFAPRELGFHMFTDTPAQNTVYFDNFALKIEGGAGNVTGNPFLQ